MIPKKLDWLDRAIEVANFHIRQLKDENNWTIEKTAVALNRSVGSVSMDITIARWSQTHGKLLRRCRSQRDAMEIIKQKAKEIKLREIES